MKKNDIVLFITIFSVLLLIAGGTYAYWIWNSNSTNAYKNVVFNTSKDIEKLVVYDEGDSIFIGNFQPTNVHCGSNSYNVISFYIDTTGLNTKEIQDLNKVDIVATINMDINAISEYMSESNDIYWVVTNGNASACTGELVSASGSFNGKQAGDVVTLLENVEITTTLQQYTIWIWIDENGSNLDLLSGEKLDVNIWTQIDMLDAGE